MCHPLMRLNCALILSGLLSLPINAFGGECVILLHGLARTADSMSLLSEKLSKAHYWVANIDYLSRVEPVDKLAATVIPRGLDTCKTMAIDEELTAIHFVTHSLGGILVRQYMNEHEIKELKRVVMMGPPNQGSEVVDNLKDMPGFEWFNGPAGMQLGTAKEDIPIQLGAVNFELGVIAGTRSINLLLSNFLPNPDDGKVSVKNTRVEGMCGFVVLPVAHPFLMQDEAVITQVLSFLKTGAFTGATAEQLCNQASGTPESKAVDVITLANNHIRLDVTPDIGGRVLFFSAKDKNNFLKVSDEVARIPAPAINAAAEYIGYLGHEMWVGPQSAWWMQQTLNAERLATAAVWPPDPYASFSRNKVIKKTNRELALESPASPISGLLITKTYSLLKDRPNSVRLDVDARNTRTEAVAWDLWFNTRVQQDTMVYVPVTSEDDVRIEHFTDQIRAPLTYRIEQGMFSFELLAPPVGKTSRRGKVFIQPAYGWMAAFNHDQAFIIQFQRQPRSNIHPEQGQVELYLDYIPAQYQAGLLELEVHAPYRTLKAAATMSATEVWTILSYPGPHTRAGHTNFLDEQIKEMNLNSNSFQ